MTLNCAIIDDEVLAVKQLENYINRTPFLYLQGSYNDAITAMADLRTQSVDILFLDIKMPDISGLELAKIIPEKTLIVFTTAYDEYAMEGYKVSAFDFLLKPISFNDFLDSANKALRWFETYNNFSQVNQMRFFFVKSDYRLVRVDMNDILYIEGQKDYVRIQLTNGEKITTLVNMKRMEELLPKPEFLRIHRSYIAHMNKVTAVEKLRLYFGDNALPVSDNYKETVAHFIEQYTLT